MGFSLHISRYTSSPSRNRTIRRFIFRRGAPQEIYLDQGTNFQGASSELKQKIGAINLEMTKTFTKIQWKLIPPYAPNMRGIWKRQVWFTKHGLNEEFRWRDPAVGYSGCRMHCQLAFFNLFSNWHSGKRGPDNKPLPFASALQLEAHSSHARLFLKQLAAGISSSHRQIAKVVQVFGSHGSTLEIWSSWWTKEQETSGKIVLMYPGRDG